MQVLFYRSPAGGCPVQDYLLELEEDERGRVLTAIEDLAQKGVAHSAVELRQVHGKLWEVKVSRHRVFYVLISGPTMVLLHAYKKQAQKAPPRELKVAKQRMKEVLRGE
jgi:phage-related protein